MKLITFDGFAGAGKTVQRRRLMHHLRDNGIDVYPHHGEPFNDFLDEEWARHDERAKMVELHHVKLLKVLSWFVIVKTAQTAFWNHGKIQFIEWFWNPLIEYGRDETLLRCSIDIMNKDGYLPDLSFYVQTPIAVANRRRSIRDNSSNEGGNAELDITTSETVAWLSKELPFFHVIDGMRDEDVIFDEILSITERSL